jgi:putative DNA primase/helicase
VGEATEDRVTTFVEFARGFGIIIDADPPLGEWRRLPTVDHPRLKNGAVRLMGDYGFAQNHATMSRPALWRGEVGQRPGAVLFDRRVIDDRLAEDRAAAAELAAKIVSRCSRATHPYLARKGFPDTLVNVWVRNGVRLLVVPMYADEGLVGCQLISENGDKRFLRGQQVAGATFTFDSGGPPVLCEGYATGLSCQAALRALRERYRVVVCFSAGNLKRVASHMQPGLVIADNDESGVGQRAAIETEWPYFVPPTPGHDFNDFHQAVSLFECSQALRETLQQLRGRRG